jgi:hypothetical protein
MANFSALKRMIDQLTPEQREDLMVSLRELCARPSLGSTEEEAKVREEEPGGIVEANVTALHGLGPNELIQRALALPESQRLELIEYLITGGQGTQALVADGVRRIEEVARGEVMPLSEEQFRAALASVLSAK